VARRNPEQFSVWDYDRVAFGLTKTQTITVPLASRSELRGGVSNSNWRSDSIGIRERISRMLALGQGDVLGPTHEACDSPRPLQETHTFRRYFARRLS